MTIHPYDAMPGCHQNVKTYIYINGMARCPLFIYCLYCFTTWLISVFSALTGFTPPPTFFYENMQPFRKAEKDYSLPLIYPTPRCYVLTISSTWLTTYLYPSIVF